MQEKDKLLVVEPDPLVSRAVEKAAAALDLDPVTATDGWDAIEKLESSQYIAVVVDSELPQNSGLGLLRYIREEFGPRSLDRVLVLAPDDDTATRLSSESVHAMRRTDEVDDLTTAIRACEPEASDRPGSS